MELKITRKYLHFPVKNKAEKFTIQFFLNNNLVREFDIELATDEKADWWAFYDMSEYTGERLQVRIKEDEPEIEEKFKALILQSDEIKDEATFYQEELRPQFHFTARRGWLNDPNGLVYLNNEYHLFFQHNPFGREWGNMHWGHAVSEDLVHWRELPLALYQKSLQDMAFSGGGLIDDKDTAGFKTGEEEVMVVSFTSTGRGECLAYSNDQGRNFQEYEDNPVLEHIGRDPKIIWYQPEEKWVMVVYEENEEEEEKRYSLYESKDLKRWHFLQSIEGFFECPELFSLPLDGDPDQQKWILHGAVWQENGKGEGYATRSSYLVGSFDGKKFIPETEIIAGHAGPHFYAAQLFNNIPDGRKIMMGWMSGSDFPGMPFNQCMSVPLELSLHSTPAGPRLYFDPVEEINLLHSGRKITGENLTTTEASKLLKKNEFDLMDIRLTVASQPEGKFALTINDSVLIYNFTTKELSFKDKNKKMAGEHDQIKIRILIDRSVSEIFVNEGLVAFAAGGHSYLKNQLSIRQDDANILSLEVYEMVSAWN